MGRGIGQQLCHNSPIDLQHHPHIHEPVNPGIIFRRFPYLSFITWQYRCWNSLQWSKSSSFQHIANTPLGQTGLREAGRESYLLPHKQFSHLQHGAIVCVHDFLKDFSHITRGIVAFCDTTEQNTNILLSPRSNIDWIFRIWISHQKFAWTTAAVYVHTADEYCVLRTVRLLVPILNAWRESY